MKVAALYFRHPKMPANARPLRCEFRDRGELMAALWAAPTFYGMPIEHRGDLVPVADHWLLEIGVRLHPDPLVGPCILACIVKDESV